MHDRRVSPASASKAWTICVTSIGAGVLFGNRQSTNPWWSAGGNLTSLAKPEITGDEDLLVVLRVLKDLDVWPAAEADIADVCSLVAALPHGSGERSG